MRPIGITANLAKPQVPHLMRRILALLKKQRQPALLENSLAERLGLPGGCTVKELARRCRLLVVLGGDGSVLRAAREIHPSPIPLFCVNLGNLGFLAAASPRHLDRDLPRVLRGEGRQVPHATLEVSILGPGRPRRRLMALNDAVISRGAVSRIVHLELRVDGAMLNSYACDGVIFSTPTGSTAYSLSAGGPLVVPEARVLAITPICPHTLTNRSVIVSARSVVETRIVSQPGEVLLGLDGQTMIPLKHSDRVRVTTGRFKVRMITLEGGSFFQLLQQKLHWTGAHFQTPMRT